MNRTVTDSTCPWCGRHNEMHDGANVDHAPDEGSVSICWECKYPSVFEADGRTLRKPTIDEYDSIMSDPEVRVVIYSMRESTRPTEALKMFEAFEAQRKKDQDGDKY